MDSSQLVEYLMFACICFTIPIQILIIYSIIRKFNQFTMNKSFFIFYIVTAFVDFINQFCMIFGVLFPAWGFFIPLYLKLGSGFGKFLLMGSFWTRINQGIACLLIALNRCSAIIWPVRYETIWKKPIIFISVFLMIFSGLPFTIFAATKEYRWYMNASTAEIYDVSPDDVKIDKNDFSHQVQLLKIVWNDNKDQKIVFVIGLVIESIVCCLLICCYVTMGFVLWKRSTSLTLSTPIYQGPREAQRRRINQQLFQMASVTCTMEVLFTIFLTIIATIHIHPNLFYALYNSLSILYSTLNPYILLVCSSYARRLVKETLMEHKITRFQCLTNFRRNKNSGTLPSVRAIRFTETSLANQ